MTAIANEQSVQFQKISRFCVFSPEPLIIPACAGDNLASLAFDKSSFEEGQESFEKWKIDINQPAVEATSVLVCQMWHENYSYDNICKLLRNKAFTFCSQEQIAKFVEMYPKEIRNDGYGTYFPFTAMVGDKERFFVTRVTSTRTGFILDVGRITSRYLWNTDGSIHMVIPAELLLIP